MNHDELESMVKSHERALCFVADTEGKALHLIRMCFAVAFTALALAFVTFFMVVAS